MQLVHLARPVPGQGPADVIRTFVFLSNLAAQEATGDRMASVTADRVLTRLAGSEESDVALFALIDTDVTPVVAPSGELGLPVIASSVGPGSERDYEVAGFAYVTVPLLEERRVLEVEFVVDVTYRPLPGMPVEPMDPEAKRVHTELLAGVEAYARRLGRDMLHLWAEPGEAAPDGFTHAVDVKQSVFELPSVEAEIPTGWSVDVVENYRVADTVAGDVARLLTEAASDADHGQLYTEPALWDPDRIRRASERQRDRGERTLLVTLSDPRGRVIALSEFSAHASGDASVAEVGVIVVERQSRGRGLGRAVLEAGLNAVRQSWPDVTRLYASASAGDTASAALFSPYAPEVIGGAVGWQKMLR